MLSFFFSRNKVTQGVFRVMKGFDKVDEEKMVIAPTFLPATGVNC